jgi:hypothetical protein
MAQLVLLSSLGIELPEPGATLLHLLSYAAITLLLWIATDGRHPNFVIGAVLALGAFNDFPAALASALAGAGLLYWRQGAGKPCAESSPRSRTET